MNIDLDSCDATIVMWNSLNSCPKKMAIQPWQTRTGLLGSFSVPMEARMFQELLESNGIVSILQSDSNAGAWIFRRHPMAILVQEVDFPKGRELYEQYFNGDPSENKELGTDDQDESA